MTDKINIAVLGAGYWGPNLIRNVAQSQNATLHTICDINAEQLAKIALEYPPLRQTTDMQSVFDDPDVHGVILATPAHTHAELAERALRAGKHTLVEKPIALTSMDSERVVKLAKDNGLILMVGHVFLYNPAVIKLKELIDGGEVGDVFYIYSTRVNLGRIRQDLDAFWNLAPHDISIINHVLGERPVRVSANGYNYLQPDKPHLHDVVFAVLEYPSGIAAHIHTSWLDPNKIRRMTVVGEKKMIVYDDISENHIAIYDKGAAWTAPEPSYGTHRLMTYTGDIHIPKLNKAEPLRAEIEHFIDCINTGQPARSDGESGLEVVRVLEGVSRSLENASQVVTL